MNLDSKKLRLVLLGSLALSVIGFIAVLVLGLGVLGNKSKQMVDLKVQSQTADAQLANLFSAKKQVEQYSYFKDVAKTVIPNDKDQATSVVEINKMAEASGILLQSITFPASSLGLTTSTTSTTGKTNQDATSSSAAKTALSQAKPVTGIPGLYSLELTITPRSGHDIPAGKQVTFDKMINFLGRIEDNRHTAQITDLVITSPIDSSTSNTGFTFVLTINIFIKP
jgi:hypothetical protein